MRAPGKAGGGGRAPTGRGRARPQQGSGKKVSFPWINSQIIAASETGGLPQLMSTVTAHLPQMNLVNLSTAVHRIAKLTSNDLHAQAQLRQDPVLEELLWTIAQVLSMMEAGDAQPQSLSNVAWSLATMRLMNRPLIQVVATLAVANISRFKPFELSTMLWAFAKLTTVDHQQSCCMKPVYQAAAAHIMKHLSESGFRCLATTAWAFATARQRHARLFRSIAAQMVPMVHVANCQEMANTAWAFATADFHDDQLFTQLAEKAMPRLDEFKPQELSNILWGFATNGFFHEAFFTHASVVTQHMSLQAQHLANILWAFVRVRPKHPVTHATILALLPSCTRQLDTFKPQEVSSTALAVAKACDAGDEPDRPPSPVMLGDAGVPRQVVEFFSCAMPWALPRLHEFSAQSLANTVSAFAMVRTHGDVTLFNAIAQEVLGRYDRLEPTALLHLLKGFSAAPQEVCGHVTKTLAAGVVHHVDSFRPQELQTLSRICVQLLHLRRSQDLSSEECRTCCVSIAARESNARADRLLDGVVARQQLGHCRSEDGSPARHNEAPGPGLILGDLLALEDELLGCREGSLPGMPPNALYEADFHLSGRPPSPSRRFLDHHGNASGYGQAPQYSGRGSAQDRQDLSPPLHIGVRPKANPRVASPGVSQKGATRGKNRNPRAIRNQAVPKTFKAAFDGASNTSLNTINESSHVLETAFHRLPPHIDLPLASPPTAVEVPTPSLAAADLAMNTPASQLLDPPLPIPLMATSPALQDAAAGGGMPDPYKWRCSVKNSFLHVEFNNDSGENIAYEDENSVDDGSSQRSSSVPSRFEYDDNCGEDLSHRYLRYGNEAERHWNKQYPDLNNLGFDWGGPQRRPPTYPPACPASLPKARPFDRNYWENQFRASLDTQDDTDES